MVHDLSTIHHSNQIRFHLPENVVKNNLSGKRKFAHSNGTFYDGMFKNGKLNGFGIILYPTKTIEEGYFENNCLNGAGRIANTKMSFEGQFKDGCLIEGKIKLSDGTSYEGKFTENLLNSSLIEENPREEILSKILFEGRITFPNGTIYENKPINDESEVLSDADNDGDTEKEGGDDSSTCHSEESFIEISSDFDHVDWNGITAGIIDEVSDVGSVDVDSDLDQIDWPRVAEGMRNGYDFNDDLSETSENEQHPSSVEQFKDVGLLSASSNDFSSDNLSEKEILNGFGVRKFHDQTEEGFFTNNELNGMGKRVFSDGLSLEGLFKNGSFVEGRITLSESLFIEGKFTEEALNSRLQMSEFDLGLCKSSMSEGKIHFPSEIEERHDNKSTLLNGTEVISEIDDQDEFDRLDAEFDVISETHLSTVETKETTSDIESEYDMLSEFDINEQKTNDDNEWIILNNTQLRG